MTKVLVVCSRQYNGHELWTALGVMKHEGHSFEVVAESTLIEDEVTHQRNTLKRTYYDVDPQELGPDFGALMIVSGNMADTEKHWHDNVVQGFVERAHAMDLPIAAICCSVPTVRRAAKGKRVSFFPLIRSRELLTNAGAILTDVACTVDGKLVTAEHQMATQMWANQFCLVLDGKPATLNLQSSGYTPRGRERKPRQYLEDLKERRAKGRLEFPTR